jgi:type II secretion system protein N
MALALPKRKQVLVAAGYTLFFVVCFVLSAYYTFPYDRARDLLVRRAAALPPPAGKEPVKLTIAEIGPHWLTGVALQGVQYEQKSTVASEPPLKLAADELTVRLSLLSLLPGDSMAIELGAEVGDGSIEGEYELFQRQPRAIEAELDEVDLDKLGLGSYLGVPLKGKASGTISMGPIDTPNTMQGDIELHIDGLKLGDGKSKIKLPGMPGGLTLDTLNAGDLDLKVAIRDGVGSIEKLESKGKDMQLTGSGSVRMAKQLGQSRVDLAMGVKVEEGYTSKSERMKAAFDLMSNSPLLKRAMTPDGTIRFRLTGPLTTMRAAPGAAAAGGAARGRKAKKDAVDEPGFVP